MCFGAQPHNGHPNIGSQGGAPKQDSGEIGHRVRRFDEQDRLLLECNFNDLATTAGEHQEHWLLAIQAAMEASHIQAQQAETAQPCSRSGKQKRAHT
jgi:hypothetical protein